MPPWSHLHPLVIHFPIALLMVAPLLVLLGLLWPRERSGIHACAGLLLLLGTVSAFLAVITGMAVPSPGAPSPALQTALEAHEQLGKWTLLLFGCLSLAFLAIQWLSRLLKSRMSPAWILTLHLLWLVLAAGALLPLTRTGHLGGRLVHELGIHGERAH
jgi:uncharacterized membrane protein